VHACYSSAKESFGGSICSYATTTVPIPMFIIISPGGGTEIGVQDGNYIIDVHGGDPSGTGGGFPKSIEVAKAIIAGLH
jgi:hypothetical protein